jgi:hypothetical protein
LTGVRRSSLRKVSAGVSMFGKVGIPFCGTPAAAQPESPATMATLQKRV